MVTDIRKVNNPFVEQTLKKLECLLFLKKQRRIFVKIAFDTIPTKGYAFALFVV